MRRGRSNTPLQALTTLNEPLFIEAAKALALLTLYQGGETDKQRVTYAFRRVLARTPSQAESAELVALLAKERGRPQSTSERWTTVSRVLLNLDETITKE